MDCINEQSAAERRIIRAPYQIIAEATNVPPFISMNYFLYKSYFGKFSALYDEQRND